MNKLLRNVFQKSYFCSVSSSRSISLSLANKKIFKIQDEKDFEEKVVKSELPVVIDFQASWCGPCKILEPRLEVVIGKHHDKIHLAKVDIDSNAELAMKYDVQAVPHVVGFRNGAPHKSFTGVRDDDQIESFVKELISS